VSACAETTFVVDETKVATKAPSQPTRYKVGQPYQVEGVWYYPAVNYDYDETGVASWYGPGFVGNATANGEVYDQNAMTAAHKTLPIPTLVRVTNLENGRQIQLRINDRGPYRNNRIIDLSRRGAQLLGMEANGTARVRVQVMAEESRQLAMQLGGSDDSQGPKPTAAPIPVVMTETLPGSPRRATPTPLPAKSIVAAAATLPQPSPAVVQEPVHPTNLFVQAGAFLQMTNADRLRGRLSGVGVARIVPVQIGAQTFYRVRLGPIASVEQADLMLGQVIAMGNKDARLVVE
ncbi:MAG: rare lipoprotein, partial [Rhodospirillaceae bacterium]|nr:rare lipoprotein [Rhodospirillaceae bacterium]